MVVKRMDPEATMVLLPADATINPAVDFQNVYWLVLKLRLIVP